MAVSLKLPLVVVGDAASSAPPRRIPATSSSAKNGTLTVSPTFTRGGGQSGRAYLQLQTYAWRVGGEAFDSNAGFQIGPRHAMKVPDASWVSKTRIATLTEGESAGFWPLSPDVAIEIKSASDDFRDTIGKNVVLHEARTRYAVWRSTRTCEKS